MSGIVEFLTARLDEDEQDAKDAASRRGPHWLAEEYRDDGWGVSRDRAVIASGKPIVTEDNDYSSAMTIDHIARHDPARVLADVAAKRAIVDEYMAAVRSVAEYPDDRSAIMAEWSFKRAVRRLAQPHADHPDFDPAWKTDA